MANILVGAVVVAIIGFAVRNLYLKKKNGGGCGCGCEGCSHKNSCH